MLNSTLPPSAAAAAAAPAVVEVEVDLTETAATNQTQTQPLAPQDSDHTTPVLLYKHPTPIPRKADSEEALFRAQHAWYLGRVAHQDARLATVLTKTQENNSRNKRAKFARHASEALAQADKAAADAAAAAVAARVAAASPPANAGETDASPDPEPSAAAWTLESAFQAARLKRYKAAGAGASAVPFLHYLVQRAKQKREHAGRVAQGEREPAGPAFALTPASEYQKRAYIASTAYADNSKAGDGAGAWDRWHHVDAYALHAGWAREASEASEAVPLGSRRRNRLVARRKRHCALAEEALTALATADGLLGAHAEVEPIFQLNLRASTAAQGPLPARAASPKPVARTSLAAQLAARRVGKDELPLDSTLTSPVSTTAVELISIPTTDTRDLPPHLAATAPVALVRPVALDDATIDSLVGTVPEAESALWERERSRLYGWRFRLYRELDDADLDLGEEGRTNHRDQIAWLRPRIEHARAAAAGERPLRYQLGGERAEIVIEGESESGGERVGERSLLPHLQRQRQPSRSDHGASPSARPSAKLVKPAARSTYPALSTYTHVISALDTPFSTLPPKHAQPPVAELAYGLDRVLFNPGVAFVRDPRSGVYNLPPELEQLPSLDDFAFDKLPQYITSSKDEALMELAKDGGKLFVGSTSSCVAMLCQISIWLGRGRELNTGVLSAEFAEQSKEFSMGQQLPASVVLHFNEGRYSIDADKSFDPTNGTNVLAEYGHLMEKFLTTHWDQFRRFLKSSNDPAPSEAEAKQAYHYSQTEHMVLRSQLDCINAHLPHKTFDLKTRATIAIRQDRANFAESASYQVTKLGGMWNSYEREYYDLIRSAFLKYQFQARIGQMDGVLVAYHSTAEFFGFQYVPVEEMDVALFGNHETGKQNFAVCTALLERVLLQARDCFKECSLEVSFQADTKEDVLRVFVAPHRPDVEDKAGQPMTLIEITGTNYLDGQSTGAVDVCRAADREPQHWQLGYRVSAHDGGPLSVLGIDKIADLFAQMRSRQLMFTDITLPTGVTRADLAASALAANEAEQAADKLASGGAGGSEGEEGAVAVADAVADGEAPSEGVPLHVRFPHVEGMSYSDRPRFFQEQLRRRARRGKKEKDARLAMEAQEGKPLVEVRTEIVERE